MIRFSLILSVFFLLSACVSTSERKQEPVSTTPKLEEKTHFIPSDEQISFAQNAVKGQLLEPDTVIFGRDIWGARSKDGSYVICGYVSAKNKMGGQSGLELFSVSQDGVAKIRTSQRTMANINILGSCVTDKN